MKAVAWLVFSTFATTLDILQVASILIELLVNLGRLGSAINSVPGYVIVLISYATEYAHVWWVLHVLVIVPPVTLLLLPTTEDTFRGWTKPRMKLGALYVLVLVPLVYYWVVIGVGLLNEWYSANLFLVFAVSIAMAPITAALIYGPLPLIFKKRGIPFWATGVGTISHFTFVLGLAFFSSWNFLGFEAVIRSDFLNTALMHTIFATFFFLFFLLLENVLQWRLTQ